MFKKLVFTLSVISSSIGFTALSPMAQSAVEIQQLLASEEVLHNLGGAESIIACEKVDDGYLVKSHDAQMKVTVRYEPQDRLGPQKFYFVYGPVEEAETNS